MSYRGRTYICAASVVYEVSGSLRYCSILCLGIIDRCQSKWLFDACTEGTDLGAHPYYIGGRSARVDDDIDSLTDAEGYHVGLIRNNGYKIIGDDLKGVIVNAEAL